MANLGVRVSCINCWSGYRSDLIWKPYNPICEFTGRDERITQELERKNIRTKFEAVCPNCGRGTDLIINT